MIELPKEKRKIQRENPKFLVVFGKPKVGGKTTAMSLLENNLIIEMEDRGADFVSGYIVNVTSTKDLFEVYEAIIAAGKPYKYITLDTATAMEDNIIQSLAIKFYKMTPISAWAA